MSFLLGPQIGRKEVFGMRLAGFFREIQTFTDGESILSSLDALPLPMRSLAAGYLRNGYRVVESLGALADDMVDPSIRKIGRKAVFTDGTWCWPYVLAYYVEKYGVRLPQEFVEFMVANSWRPPSVSKEQRSAILREFGDAFLKNP
jgi:hypothetical protein